MTFRDRIEAFAAAFPNPAARPYLVEEQGRQVMYATWLMGQNYQATAELYGAYPPHYLDRVMALFPDMATGVLHVFSGSLPPSDRYERCDLVQPAEIQASVYDLPQIILNWSPALVIADPPYSADDAERYGTRMVDRPKAIKAIAAVTKPGGFLCWLDCVWPMHRKDQWRTVGRITVIRSTNHRVRLLSIFERTRAAA